MFEASVEGGLDRVELRWRPEAAVCVVLASGGYPGAYAKGKPISGLTAAGQAPNTKVFHAGTARVGDRVVTQGGRVVGVTAWATSLQEARAAAYRAVEQIEFDGKQFRRDIAAQAVRS